MPSSLVLIKTKINMQKGTVRNLPHIGQPQTHVGALPFKEDMGLAG